MEIVSRLHLLFVPRRMKGNSSAKTPAEYLRGLPKERKKALTILHRLIRKAAPQLKPYMQSGVIGYGKFPYRYASGREGEWATIALASQKNYISLYACVADGKQYVAELYKKELPKADIGKSCIRFRRIEDVDLAVIERLIRHAARMKNAFTR
jgi:hypothetical protein